MHLRISSARCLVSVISSPVGSGFASQGRQSCTAGTAAKMIPRMVPILYHNRLVVASEVRSSRWCYDRTFNLVGSWKLGSIIGDTAHNWPKTRECRVPGEGLLRLTTARVATRTPRTSRYGQSWSGPTYMLWLSALVATKVIIKTAIRGAVQDGAYEAF